MRVLLADDSESMRSLISAVLVACGHDVTTTSNGAAAWEAFASDRHPLVVLDWQMPELDGLEVCRRIRALEAGRQAFVLVVTARDGEEDLQSVLDAGADDYVSKPVTADHLRARLIIAERRIQVDAARRAAEEALARAQWLAGIGETAIAVQHEINNPLAALVGHATLLAADPALDERLREPLEAILELGRRMAGVVQRLAQLENPRSVEYLEGMRMIDISGRPPGVRSGRS